MGRKLALGKEYFSVYASDGDVLLSIKDESGWGDWVKVASGSAFEDSYPATSIKIKAVSGSVSVDYYIRGSR